MKANEFVKKFGWDNSKECLRILRLRDTDFPFVCVCGDCTERDDLERLVESHDLVSSFGGIKRAKRILKKSYMSFSTMVSVVWNDKPFQCTLEQLEQAIADVESCYVD